jgi:hypothetical protein
MDLNVTQGLCRRPVVFAALFAAGHACKYAMTVHHTVLPGHSCVGRTNTSACEEAVHLMGVFAAGTGLHGT